MKAKTRPAKTSPSGTPSPRSPSRPARHPRRAPAPLHDRAALAAIVSRELQYIADTLETIPASIRSAAAALAAMTRP